VKFLKNKDKHGTINWTNENNFRYNFWVVF
jgi:hypothetical protein